MFCELVEKSITDRGNIIEAGQLDTMPCDYERYVSLFYADQSLKDHVKVNNSVAGFKGKRTARVLWIDIDNENPITSFNSMRTIIAGFNSQYGVSPDDLFIYFSGNKGYHIGIHQNTIGQMGWHDDFAERTKQFICSVCDPKLIDTKIYEPQRIFRVPNSKHGKSGLYKIPLNYDELKGFEHIRELAKQARPEFKRKKPINQILQNDELHFKWQLIEGKKEIQETTEQGDFFSPPAAGNRNNQLYKQAFMLFQNSTLSMKSVYQIISSINNASKNPLNDDEIRNLVMSASKKMTEKKQVYDVRTIGGWDSEWYESILPEQNKISMVFPMFDDELKGKLRGKLVVLVGSAGTKKSLFAKNIVFRNMIHSNSRSVYSTMEMGATDAIDRFVNMCIDGFNCNPTYYLEMENKRQPGYALKVFKDKIAPFYEDKLLLSQNIGMTAGDYDTMIGDIESKYGKVDILVTDGLSMMGGKGTETELVNANTKELKQLAVKRNICVLLIVHITKEGDKFTVDCGNLMRASNKILDNCDMYLSLSCIKNGMSDEPDPSKGNVRLVNKRGSGSIIDCIYDFDKFMLLMKQSEYQK